MEPVTCPVRTLFDHITSKWGVLVLVALDGRTLRWAQLRRVVDGVTEKMLAQTLRTLEADGLVRREALPVVPPHVEYSLTADGQEVVARLLPLLDWMDERTGVERGTSFGRPEAIEIALAGRPRRAGAPAQVAGV